MTPDFNIIADRNDITTLIRDRVLSLAITDESGTTSDTFEMQLDDREGKIVWPTHGAELEIALGFRETGVVPKGTYIVDEVEHSGPANILTVRGKAANMRASLKAQKTRSWDGITIGDLVATIAAEHRLEAKVAEVFTSTTIAHIDQNNESDLHFLTRIAREYGAVTKPVTGFLVFVPKGEAKSLLGKPIEVIGIKADHIIRHRMTQAERGKYSAVRAYWVDVASAEKQPVVVGEGEPIYTIRHTYPNVNEATLAALSKLKSLRRGTANMSLTLVGQPVLQAEGKIRIDGIRDPVNGEWIITRVEHHLDGNGLITRCDSELPNKNV